jgi:hypothetical protein
MAYLHLVRPMERVVRVLLLPFVAATLAQPARAQKHLVLQTAEDRQDK